MFSDIQKLKIILTIRPTLIAIFIKGAPKAEEKYQMEFEEHRKWEPYRQVEKSLLLC